MSDCIFCKLVSGEIPGNIVYQDEDVLAFEDLNPQTPSHTLLIPKKHYTNLNDDIPEELLGKLFGTVKKIAKIKGIDKTGYRIIANAGEDGRQTVFHLHIHILGGTTLPISMGPAD
jgi:histidine triad (HIT) family protein